ncbi:hypothetical protein B0H19DRAFT_1077081 [Mycena capillaripes]|nr:hypothetical protein B0H19DRAFT_1077081 [Mycena capillaripes]
MFDDWTLICCIKGECCQSRVLPFHHRHEIPLVPLISTLVAALPIRRCTEPKRQAEATCITGRRAVDGLIKELEGKVRWTPRCLHRSTTHRDSQTYVDNILAVIATPDSWYSINGDGFGGYDCQIIPVENNVSEGREADTQACFSF